MRSWLSAVLSSVLFLTVHPALQLMHSANQLNLTRSIDQQRDKKIGLPYPVHMQKQSSFFPAYVYSSKLGFLTYTPGVYLSMAGKSHSIKSKYLLGRIYELNHNRYLPQMNQLKGYEPFDVQANGHWVTWIYQSMGIGEDFGERIYAFNTVTSKEYCVWVHPLKSLDSLIGIDLTNNALYYGVQGFDKNQVTVAIHSMNLQTLSKRIVLSSKGHGVDPVIEDFSVTNHTLGVIWTSASHFVSSTGLGPYKVTLDSLAGKPIRTIYHGEAINPFDMHASGGTWIWSDQFTGVHAYSLRTNQVWEITKIPSYTYSDGSTIWWKSINTDETGGFDMIHKRYFNIPSSLKGFSPVVTGGLILFYSRNRYAWIKPN